MKYIYKKIAPYLKNWRTSLLGLPLVFGGLGSLVTLLHEVSVGNNPSIQEWQNAGAVVLAGFAAIFAKDAQESGLASNTKK